MKKRIASLILTFILVISCLNIPVFAADQTPIIIIPGYLGSKLYADTELEERLFGEYGTANEFLAVDAVEFVVKRPVNLQKAAEFGAGNKYKALCNAICAAYPKRKVYFFSYDFTKDSKSAAVLLDNFINSIGGKANLVCVSYGGLVATHYFALNNNNFNKINKTVCIGVPFEGSAYAQLATVSNIFGSADIGELLPTKRYLEKMDLQGEGGINQEFLYSDGKPVMLNNKNAYYAIGGGKITASGIILDENGNVSDMVFDNDGDGIVTKMSATMIDGLGDNVKVFDLTHSELISSSQVSDWVIAVIKGKAEPSQENYKKGYDVIKISGNATIKVTGGMGVMEEEGGPLTQNEYGQLIELDENNKYAALVRSDSSINLTGTADGFVSLNIKRFDENNKMICSNGFVEIPVNKDTAIRTVLSDEEMWLYIDKNNDGVFEENACSLKNGEYSFTTKAPVPSAKEGRYNKAFFVKLESETEKVKIYYTLDGTDPLTNGKLYEEEIRIDKTCTLKAVSVRENYTTGDILEVNYEINKLGIIITILLWIIIIAVLVFGVIFIIKKKKTKQQGKSQNELQKNI